MKLAALPWLGVAASALLVACGSPIVGAECRDGFVACDGVCVDLTSDPDHCGACEDSCGDFTCEDSDCTTTPRPDGGGDGDGDGDGDRDGGGGTGGRDAGESPIGTGNPFRPDAGFNFPDPGAGGCPIGTIVCSGRCVDPGTHTPNCGGCGRACDADQFCSLGMCVEACEEPLQLCVGACVDYETDPLNCGGCRNICQSGICIEGECADAVPGHIVVIGHDFQSRSATAMRLVAFGALDRAIGMPIRTLVYADDTSENALNAIRDALDSGSDLVGRAWQEELVSADDLTLELFNADALVITPQDQATNERLITHGQNWSVALAQFVARGGVIVLFETRMTSNAGTFQLLQPSGFFAASGHRTLPNNTQVMVDTNTIIGSRGIPPTYVASRTSVAFEGLSTPGQVVVRTSDGRPVVVHWVITP